MYISKLGGFRNNVNSFGLPKVSNPMVTLNSRKSSPQMDTFSFSGNKVVENLIVEDLDSFDIDDCDTKDFSQKLKQSLLGLEVLKEHDSNENDVYLVKDGGKDIIRIEKNEKRSDVKPGFIFGKTGTYATLEISGKKGKYVVVFPEDSILETEDGLTVRVAGKRHQHVSFTGSTGTVNAFYKPEKTIDTVKAFLDLIENSDLFNGIEKSDKNYSEYFHPYILAGGFGSRLESISYTADDNKPSTATPIPNWKLIDFSLLNLYQANLLNRDTDIDYIVQKEANSAVGCVITTLGYKIDMTKDGLDLVKDGTSVVPPNKNLVIMPSDNITDIELTKPLDAFLANPKAGMLVVGVPDYRCYGGLILHNDKDEIETFITKPPLELLRTGLGAIKCTDHLGKEHILRDPNGLPTALGNAFIYIIKPDVLDSIADIYRNKIRNAYQEMVKSKNGDTNLNKEEYLNVIECFWDREIIPQLVDLSKANELRDSEGNPLKVVTYQALGADWSDVGEFSSYYTTIQNAARKDCYTNLPKSIKESLQNHILDNVIFNVDAKEDFKEFVGHGYVEGNIVVVPKK